MVVIHKTKAMWSLTLLVLLVAVILIEVQARAVQNSTSELEASSSRHDRGRRDIQGMFDKITQFLKGDSMSQVNDWIGSLLGAAGSIGKKTNEAGQQPSINLIAQSFAKKGLRSELLTPDNIILYHDGLGSGIVIVQYDAALSS